MAEERKRWVGNWKIWAVVLLLLFGLWHLIGFLAGGSVY